MHGVTSAKHVCHACRLRAPNALAFVWIAMFGYENQAIRDTLFKHNGMEMYPAKHFELRLSLSALIFAQT